MPKLAAHPLLAAALVVLALARPAWAQHTVALDEATLADLRAALDAGTITSEQLVSRSLARIDAYDQKGPRLRAMLTLNPKALETARALDAERKAKGPRSPLHGIPVVLKDNYDTADLPTTAGSVLLESSLPPDDAFLVKRLREAGAVILGKANMSEFASGPAFSSLGGQMRNPHDVSRSPGGSSGGSAIAVAAAYAPLALGTDTGGSIRNPSTANGIVGLKTTHGLLSRDGIIPLALSFDTAGPMARHVSDVATVLGVLAGADPADSATAKSAGHVEADYTTHLKIDALKGARVGVARNFFGVDPEVDWAMEAALRAMVRGGATLVDVRLPKWVLEAKGEFYDAMRYPEFAAQIGAYLGTLAPQFPKDIETLVERAMNLFVTRGQGAGPNPGRWNMMRREASSGPLTDVRYTVVRDHGVPMIRALLDGLMSAQRLDALVYPTSPRRPATLSDPPSPPGGDADSPVNLANLTGFPDLVVPAGFSSDDLPVGLSFLGRPFSEGRLLALGYSLEQAMHVRRLPPTTPLLPGDTLTTPEPVRRR